jgi:hypothetical protein
MQLFLSLLAWLRTQLVFFVTDTPEYVGPLVNAEKPWIYATIIIRYGNPTVCTYTTFYFIIIFDLIFFSPNKDLYICFK